MEDSKKAELIEMIPNFEDGVIDILTETLDSMGVLVKNVCINHRMPPQTGIYDRDLCVTYTLTLYSDFYRIQFPCLSYKGMRWDIPDVKAEGLSLEELQECFTISTDSAFLSWGHGISLEDNENLIYNSEPELRKKVTLTIDASTFYPEEKEDYEALTKVIEQRVSKSLELEPAGKDADGCTVFDLTHLAAQKNGVFNRTLGHMFFNHHEFENSLLHQIRMYQEANIKEVFITDKPFPIQAIKFL